VGAAVMLLSPRGADSDRPAAASVPRDAPAVSTPATPTSTAQTRREPAGAVSPDEFPTAPLD